LFPQTNVPVILTHASNREDRALTAGVSFSERHRDIVIVAQSATDLGGHVSNNEGQMTLLNKSNAILMTLLLEKYDAKSMEIICWINDFLR
jgi:hypothetical protein